MMMMMRIMMMMNCFCGMVDRRKAFNLISSWDHCQRPSPSRISDTPGARYEPAQNLSSGFVEWSCAALIITTPRRHTCQLNNYFLSFFWIYVYCSFGISLSSYFFFCFTLNCLWPNSWGFRNFTSNVITNQITSCFLLLYVHL